MRVYVSAYYPGSLRHEIRFRHDGEVVRESVRAKTWDRKAATEALDLLQYCYGVKRRNVRFCQQ
jgi:hypothetical protein